MVTHGSTLPDIAPSGEIQQRSPLVESLRAHGFALSDEVIQNIENAIQKDPSLASAIQSDISAIQKNPAERDRFETMYLKGYGQVVEMKNGEKVTLAELLKRENTGETNISDNIKSDSDFVLYDTHKTRVLNQKVKEEKNVDEALNQEKTKLDKDSKVLNQVTERTEGKKEALNQMNEKLGNLGEVAKKSMDSTGLSKFESLKNTELQQIQAAPEKSPIVAKLQKEGASIADIQSGKYTDYIDAYILTQHATELTPKDAAKEKEFRAAVRQLSETMGIEATTKNIQPFLESKVLGPERAQITNTLETAVNTGKYETMHWDKDTRSIILDGKNGEKRIIETANIPPRESIQKNGLSISREIVPLSKEEQEKGEKERNLTQKTIDTQKSEQKYTDFIKTDANRKSYATLSEKPEIKTLIAEKETLQNEYGTLGDTGKKIENIGKMLKNIEDINNLRKKDDTLLTETGIENTLENERFILHDIQKNLGLQLQAEKEIPKGNEKKGDDIFEKNAEYNLNILTTLGYDKLGQKNTERIISFLNSPENPKKSEMGEINLNQKLDTPKNQALTLAIANLVRAGRKENTKNGEEQTSEQKKNEESQKRWDGVDKTDHIIAYRQTQSSGFKEALASVGRNMTQEGGELKMRGQLNSALFGGEGISNEGISSLNTQGTPPPTLA